MFQVSIAFDWDADYLFEFDARALKVVKLHDLYYGDSIFSGDGVEGFKSFTL